MKKVLVAGATGYLGRYVINKKKEGAGAKSVNFPWEKRMASLTGVTRVSSLSG